MGVNDPTPTAFVPYHAFDNLIMRGTRATQPLATKVTPGSLYNVTDEQTVERSSGLTWESYSSSMVLPSNIAYTDAANLFTQNQTAPAWFASGPYPLVMFVGTSEAVDQKKWRVGAWAGQLMFATVNDAENLVQSTPLTLYRDGRVEAAKAARPEVILTTVGTVAKGRLTSLVAASGGDIRLLRNCMFDGANWNLDDTAQPGAQLSNGQGGLVYGTFDAGANPRIHTQRLTVDLLGNATFGGHVIINTASASFSHYDTSGTVDARRWKWQAANSALTLYALNDADTAVVSTPLIISRLGNLTIDSPGGQETRLAGNPFARLHLRDKSQASGSQTFVLLSYSTVLYICPTTDDGSMYPAGKTWDAGLTLGRNGNLQSWGYMYPGRVDTPGAQGTWFIAGHASYGLYINTGLYIVGGIWTASGSAYFTGDLTATGSIGCTTNVWRSNLHTQGQVYPGMSGTSQVSWYLGHHTSYGLYSNTGLYLESNIWAAGVYSRAILSGTHVETTAHIRAATGVYDYARGNPMGGWIQYAVGQGNIWSYSGTVTFNSADYVYTLIGNTCICSFAFNATVSAANNYLYIHIPVTALRSAQVSVCAYLHATATSQITCWAYTTAGQNYLTFFTFQSQVFAAGAFNLRGQIAVQF